MVVTYGYISGLTIVIGHCFLVQVKGVRMFLSGVGVSIRFYLFDPVYSVDLLLLVEDVKSCYTGSLFN